MKALTALSMCLTLRHSCQVLRSCEREGLCLSSGDFISRCSWTHSTKGVSRQFGEDVVNAFFSFKEAVASAQLHYRQTHESRPHYERFGRLLSGSGSDTAEVIRIRHSFMLGELYSQIRIIPLDPSRCFDPLEKEVIWNRDRGICQNPACGHPERRVPFREATIHHVIEHTAGGRTMLQNGVLICPECHVNRAEMQRLTSHFQEYLGRIYANAAQQPVGGVIGESRDLAGDVADENGAAPSTTRLKIVIDWGALDVDREPQTISGGPASDLVVKLLVELLGAFGSHMEQQLTELPVIRYPLSRSPATAFLNPATGIPFGSICLPGTDLHFCPQSSTREKERRLKELFSRLTLPDGSNFPEGSVECVIEQSPS